MSKILDRQFFAAGTVFIKQGSAGDCAYMIESGRVEVFVRNDDGTEIIISELGPKALVGEMAVITGKPRNASARAVDETVLIAIPAKDMRDAMKSGGSLQNTLREMIIHRFKDTTSKLGKIPGEAAKPGEKKPDGKKS